MNPTTIMTSRKWSDSELRQALELYVSLKKAGSTSSDAATKIEKLASRIGRSFSSVSMRLANYKWLDTDGREGLSNGGANLRHFWDRNKQSVALTV